MSEYGNLKPIPREEARVGDYIFERYKPERVTGFAIGFEGGRFFYIDKDNVPRYVKLHQFYRKEGG